MPATTNKQRVVNQILTTLKKRYDPEEPEQRPVPEQFLYAICREGASRRQADRAFHSLQETFFDWNELRVSSPHEVEEALSGLPDAENRANRLISFLQEVFETTYSFDLESLHKKPLKQAAKQLSRYQAANDYSVAWVVQQSLGGHAIPLDDPSRQALSRLGLLEDEAVEDGEGSRTGLEHFVPKSRGSLFVELVSALAHDSGWENDPSCPLRSFVLSDPDSDEDEPTPVIAHRGARPKPR